MTQRLASVIFLACVPLARNAFGDSDKPFPPHRVIGDVYYVGSNDLAVFLIRTPEGHVLINSGTEETVPLIRAAVEKLGLRFADIKILLEGQAHLDHVGGHALVKQLTGARVLAMAGDDDVITSGGAGDFQYQARWKPCPVDRVLHDGEAVTLGGVVLTAHLTPGHTKGCTTWTLTTEDKGRPYHVVIVGSANFNPGYRLVNNAKYPQIAQDFARTYRVLKALACDVFLGSHGSYYGMAEKFAKVGSAAENPFVDPQGYREFVAQAEQAFDRELAAQGKNPSIRK